MRVTRQFAVEHDTVLWRVVPEGHLALRMLKDADIFTPEQFVAELSKKGAFIIQSLPGSPPSVWIIQSLPGSPPSV